MREAPSDFDGISELWFDDLPSMQRAFSSDLVEELAADEASFIGDLKFVTAIQQQVVPVPKGARLIKRMSTLKRRPDVSLEKFQHEWFHVHSVLVKRLPEVKGYPRTSSSTALMAAASPRLMTSFQSTASWSSGSAIARAWTPDSTPLPARR